MTTSSRWQLCAQLIRRLFRRNDLCNAPDAACEVRAWPRSQRTLLSRREGVMRDACAVFSLIGLMLGAGTASADPIVIATRSIDSSSTHPASVGNGIGRFSLFYPRGPILFEDFRITAATVGDTFV